MHHFTGSALLALACLGLCPLMAVAQDDWDGAWTGYVCPPGSAVNPARCASLYLRLYSRNARVCGSHVFATAGAKEMDEGGTPSIVASVEHKLARGTVQSTRASPALSIPLSMQLDGQALRWQLGGNPDGDYLLPRNLALTRSKQGGMLSPMFEQRLSASCAAYLDMPANNSGPTPSPPARR
jgi:hypothetical protein